MFEKSTNANLSIKAHKHYRPRNVLLRNNIQDRALADDSLPLLIEATGQPIRELREGAD
jgi:hypothetical protein